MQALPLTPLPELHSCDASLPRLVRFQGQCTALSSIQAQSYACSWCCSSCQQLMGHSLYGQPLQACCDRPVLVEVEKDRCELKASLLDHEESAVQCKCTSRCRLRRHEVLC